MSGQFIRGFLSVCVLEVPIAAAGTNHADGSDRFTTLRHGFEEKRVLKDTDCMKPIRGSTCSLLESSGQLAYSVRVHRQYPRPTASPKQPLS
ncbi:hypothetical protein B0T10DRAFT_164385 [Thelonectria olida]|uniref:Secreted protein n=1 Tax=Thelonectria olida TaxID=1576542 RepID=A0A9P8WE14_9HYPO|nr:hypothetical protein B0T10DRAFT_164385 [Thelonectria olida]